MKPYVKRILTCLVGIIYFSVSHAQIPQTVKDEIQNRVNLEINPSIVLAIHDSLGDHYFTKGFAVPDQQVKATSKSRYRIGNMGNTLTGLLTAKLATAGTVKTETSLGSLVTPALPLKDLRGRPISILDVATHTSGLSDKKGLSVAPNANWDALYEDGVPERMSPYRSGELFLYSDWAMALLANGLAEHTKTPYSQLLKREVISPLGLNLTCLAQGQNESGLATGCSPNGDIAPAAPLSLPTMCWAASAEGMLDYGKKILTPNPEMKSAITTAVQTYHTDETGVGTTMGWLTDNAGNLYHAGHIKGFNTFMAIDLKNKKVIAIATNTDAADITDIGLHLLDPGSHPLQRFIQHPITPDLLSGYSGTYINDAMGTTLQLEIQEDNLKVIQAEDTLSLYFMGDHRFFYKGLKAHLEFENNEDGQVVGVTLFKNGKQMMFIKTD